MICTSAGGIVERISIQKLVVMYAMGRCIIILALYEMEREDSIAGILRCSH